LRVIDAHRLRANAPHLPRSNKCSPSSHHRASIYSRCVSAPRSFASPTRNSRTSPFVSIALGRGPNGRPYPSYHRSIFTWCGEYSPRIRVASARAKRCVTYPDDYACTMTMAMICENWVINKNITKKHYKKKRFRSESFV
jgi:hypothetical protein